MKNLLSSIILTIGMLSCASCTDLMKDDGSRGFANVATIVEMQKTVSTATRDTMPVWLFRTARNLPARNGVTSTFITQKTTGPPLPMA